MNPTTPEFDYEKKVWGAPDMSAAPTSLGAWHVRHCLRALTGLQGTVLEIGCGAGGMTRTIRKARPDLTVIGLDYSQRSLGIAREHGGSYIRGDALALPFANNSFAAVVLFDVLEHLPDPGAALAEIVRILEPRGIFHAFVPMEGNLRSLHGVARRLGYVPKRRYAGHIQQFTDEELRRHLRQRNLKVTSWRHAAHYINQIVDLSYFTALAISRRQVGESLEGIASRAGGRLRGRVLGAAVALVARVSFAETTLFGAFGGAGVHLTASKGVSASYDDGDASDSPTATEREGPGSIQEDIRLERTSPPTALPAMRILMIQPWIRLGGAELLTLELAAELERRGHEVRIAALFVDPIGLPDVAQGRTYILPPRWLAARFALSRNLCFLSGPFVLLTMVALRSGRTDLLNPHNLPAPVVAALVAPIRGIPVVWNLNEVPVPLPSEQARQLGLIEQLVWIVGAACARLVSRIPRSILVLDEKTRRSVRKHYGLDSRVAMPGLRITGFEDDARDRSANHRQVQLLAIGKLHPQKNLALAIEVAGALRDRGRHVSLTIVGSGPLRDDLAVLADGLGLSEMVWFRSRLSSEELARCYAESDVLLVTPVGHQAWGLTPFEGIAAGVPSVVSDQAGASEILAARHAALVVRPECSAFADAVEHLLEHRELGALLVENGRKLLREELTWARYAERCEVVFREALAGQT